MIDVMEFGLITASVILPLRPHPTLLSRTKADSRRGAGGGALDLPIQRSCFPAKRATAASMLHAEDQLSATRSEVGVATSYLAGLERAAEHPRPMRKGQRTRARLLAATARIMAAKGYVGLRVADVAVAADMSNGAFHAYFDDREEAAREVLSGLIGHLYLPRSHTIDAGGARGLALMLRRHLAALQADAPLVRALSEALLLDEALEHLFSTATALWRVRLSAALHGLAEAEFLLEEAPRPDVVDLLVEGMVQRAGRPFLTESALTRLAVEISRLWLVTQRRSGLSAAEPGEPRRARWRSLDA